MGDLHCEGALKIINEGAVVRKLSLSRGSACAVTFSAAVFLCRCGRAPGTAIRQCRGTLRLITESQTGLGWKGRYRSSHSNPPPWARTPSTRSGCSKPHPTWPWLDAIITPTPRSVVLTIPWHPSFHHRTSTGAHGWEWLEGSQPRQRHDAHVSPMGDLQ